MGWTIKESHPANLVTDTASILALNKRLIDDPGQVCYSSSLTGLTLEAARPHEEATTNILPVLNTLRHYRTSIND